MASQKKKDSTKYPDKFKLDDFTSLIELFKRDDEFVKKKLTSLLKDKISNSDILKNEDEIFFLYDSYEPISDYHLNAIYRILPKDKSKNLILFIHSDGGSIEPAYMLSKSFNKLKKSIFSVVIPRKAKSAATLISLGADEIHMGTISQLGPIDPQFKGFPSLGLVNALERISELIKKYPTSSDMFSKYISNILDIRILGYLERINESAVQYAERLLKGRKFPKGKSAKDLAEHFVNHYKAHGFVIDVDESKDLLGDLIVKENSDYYKLGEQIFQNFDMIEFMYRYMKNKKFSFFGAVDDAIVLSEFKNRK